MTWLRQRRTTASMDLRFTGSTCLRVPDVDDGLVTWYDITLVDDEPERIIEVTRAADIHAGQATCDVGEDMHDVLDADSGALEALYPVYFDADGLKDDVSEGGAGLDVLYIEPFELPSDLAGRCIEHAVVRRLCDVLGGGCAIAVIRCTDPGDVQRWAKLGFEITRPGLMHLDLGHEQPRVLEVGTDRFRDRSARRRLSTTHYPGILSGPRHGSSGETMSAMTSSPRAFRLWRTR